MFAAQALWGGDAIQYSRAAALLVAQITRQHRGAMCVPLQSTAQPGIAVALIGNANVAQLRNSLSEQDGWVSEIFEIRSDIRLEKPIFIVGAPRSGTSLLFETLSECPDIWTVGGESSRFLEPPDTDIVNRGHRLNAADATGSVRATVSHVIISLLRNRDGDWLRKVTKEEGGCIRVLEKTPRNCLRIPFLRAVFPDARFLFIYREPEGNIASLIDGWRRQGQTYQVLLEGWPWSYFVPPNWRELVIKSIPEICAAQWSTANEFILNDLQEIPSNERCCVSYESLIRNPQDEILRLVHILETPIDSRLERLLKSSLPVSKAATSSPHPDKWLSHRREIEKLLPSLSPLRARLGALKDAVGPW
jgi:hypothetical protein